MGFISLYAVPKKGVLKLVTTYKNSSGGAHLVWEYLFQKYIKCADKTQIQDNYDDVFQLSENKKINSYEKVCLELTFDKAILKLEHIPSACLVLDTMFLAINGADMPVVNHLKSISEDLKKIYLEKKVYGVCFNWTSITEGWKSDKEERLWDIFKDSGHWFLFE